MTQVIIFTGCWDAHGFRSLENTVNRWLKENSKEIVVDQVISTNMTRLMTITIVYHAKEG